MKLLPNFYNSQEDWRNFTGFAIIFLSSCFLPVAITQEIPSNADFDKDPNTVAYVIKTVTLIPVNKNGSFDISPSEAEKFKVASEKANEHESQVDRLVRAAKAMSSSDYEVVVLKKKNPIDPIEYLKDHLDNSQDRRSTPEVVDPSVIDSIEKDFVSTPEKAHGADWIFEPPSNQEQEELGSKQNRSRRSFQLSSEGNNEINGGEKLYSSGRYCGFSPKVDPSRLSNASPGQYPWSVAILSPDNKFLCSGTLISESIVMTTASCVVRYRNIIRNNQPMKVVLGAWSLPEGYEYLPELQIYVSAAALHPNFDSNDLNSATSILNNLALLRLAFDVDFDIYHHVFPICIIGPSLATQASTARCQVLGWPDLPEMESWRTRTYMSSGEVHLVPQGCPGAPESSGACIQGQACIGNEGSVVQCLADSNRYYQWGMITQEPNCNRESSVTFPILNIINHYNFISEFIWTPNPNPQPLKTIQNPILAQS